MYSAGRQGQTDHLDLENAGLEADNRGRIFVDDNYQTKVDHIYAVGDVIGFPALAATSMEQGRLAAYHAFGEPCKGMTELQPIGIYSIPEVSYVGATEVELTKDSIPYEVGVSRYRELARGQIAGDSYGMLKLLVSTEDLTLLGVHIFGTDATEMVHIGQAVMGCGGTVEYLVDAVFNYPTFSEAYKVAALDVMNKLRALSQFKARTQQSSSNAAGAPSAGPPASARSAAGDRIVERRRVRDVLVAAAAVEAADQPVIVEPSTHGAPLVPSTSPPHGSDGKPPGASSVAAWQPIGPPPTPSAYPVTVTTVPGVGAAPASSPPPASASTEPPPSRLTRAIAKSAIGSWWHPARVEVDRVDVPEVLRVGVVGEARRRSSVDAVGHAVRRGEDQVAARASPAPPAYTCAALPPRNTAPTLGSGGTGAAVVPVGRRGRAGAGVCRADAGSAAARPAAPAARSPAPPTPACTPILPDRACRAAGSPGFGAGIQANGTLEVAVVRR